MRKLTQIFFILIFSCISLVSYSDQTTISEYYRHSSATNDAFHIFWRDLYPNGGWTLYCGHRYEDRNGLNIEHIYPASWVGDYLQCGTREECRENPEHGQRYNHMEADLHNLYASIAEVNRARSNYIFDEIEGEDHYFDYCDFERKKLNDIWAVEPRPIARGNVARSIFYMHEEYGLPIKQSMLGALKKWNKDDPPSCHEMRRNNKIEELQGTRNRFIDHPDRANRIH